MKFSVNWLREFTELPSKVEDLAELLTQSGIEIEGIEKRGANFNKVVVAQITASSQHPNADRLSVCQVDDGSGKTHQVVCGAKNYKVDDKVPLALPGAVLAGDLKIKASKLRGVESEGMLCSGTELGLSQDSEGLLILAPDAEIGAPLGSLFPEDTILDVEITPNRGDLLSHLGLAREISALVGQPLRLPSQATTVGAPVLQGSDVRISALRECPFYSARRIENVTVGPSPNWLRARLESMGLRSINNVVDVTNFVMLEIGQPLHAFDADKLNGRINVRFATENEKFLALDGRTYSLGQENLVIADDARAVGIAGVMGGEDTGVTKTTRNLILESAYFLPGSVRRTARTLSLSSDSSYRFERGVDPGTILAASQRATELISELAGGNPAPAVATAGALPPVPPNVTLRYGQCTRLIGLPIPSERIKAILEGFGLEEVSTSERETLWRVPTYRSDLRREPDLIEEVVRVFGIERVPVRDRSRFTPESEADRTYDLESGLRQRLTARGLSEARTSALIPRRRGLFDAGALELRNPLSEDHVALRPTLLAGLLDILARNVRVGAASIRFFELGHIFSTHDATEKTSLGLVFSGNAKSSAHWRDATRQLDFFDLKSVVETIGIEDLSFRRSERPGLSLCADVLSGPAIIGFLGQLATAQAEAAGAASPVFLAEIEIGENVLAGSESLAFREIEKFPAIRRDVAMIVPEDLTHSEIMAVLEGAREPLLATIELFDLFSGKGTAGLGEGKKSLAYTLTYRDKTRTLTNDEISVVHAKIRERLQRELGVELRE